VTVCRALALTDEQLIDVMTAASTIPPGQRCRYLTAIADQLTGFEITDARVHAAGNFALERFASTEL
jgi:hypothetical protein